MQEYTAAVDVFERLLEFQPDNLGHYTNLGRFDNYIYILFSPILFILLQFSRDGGGLCRG